MGSILINSLPYINVPYYTRMAYTSGMLYEAPKWTSASSGPADTPRQCVRTSAPPSPRQPIASTCADCSCGHSLISPDKWTELAKKFISSMIKVMAWQGEAWRGSGRARRGGGGGGGVISLINSLGAAPLHYGLFIVTTMPTAPAHSPNSPRTE